MRIVVSSQDVVNIYAFTAAATTASTCKFTIFRCNDQLAAAHLAFALRRHLQSLKLHTGRELLPNYHHHPNERHTLVGIDPSHALRRWRLESRNSSWLRQEWRNCTTSVNCVMIQNPSLAIPTSYLRSHYNPTCRC
jgi:hypothetical protein